MCDCMLRTRIITKVDLRVVKLCESSEQQGAASQELLVLLS